MSKRKFLSLLLLTILISSLFVLNGCKQSDKKSLKNDVQIYDEDKISDRIRFGKKYYSLGYDGYAQNEYYTFNQDNTATYTHIMLTNDKVTFQQEIYYKWTYAGQGECILVHNGTKIIKGEQDDAFGIKWVIHLSKNIIYWSNSGENTYFILEDYISEIPNYAKLINN